MRTFFPLAILLCLAQACTTAKWRLAPGHITTRWAREVNPRNAWPEYPRPQMTRPDWKNLNGLWSYAIQPKEAGKPERWEGSILVPYPVESALSGVKRRVGPEHKLWYKTRFSVPGNWQEREIVLHFEAVDWECEIWVNGHPAGTHRGGYDAFEFDITTWLQSGQNELIVSVFDPVNSGTQPVGKQTLQPGGIYYTPVTGIWQTVWLEPVPRTHLAGFKAIPDIDAGTLTIEPDVQQPAGGERVVAEAFFQGEKTGTVSASAGEKLVLPVPNARLWEPGQPNLYDLKIKILRGETLLDEVFSYFGMRKIALGKDTDGFTKILLNNRFVFQNGPLDQGFWPDGIYTAPGEAALRYDLEVIQKMSFNMLRKHVKVEPRLFYYWCDRMGLLVWQDMPNGDRNIAPDEPDITRTEASARQFETELERMISQHFNHPSIVLWVPFNEGWGQYETAHIAQLVKRLDPTRLVNAASGWSDRKVGDVLDWHNYPDPVCPPAEESRAVVLGEFGGLGLKTEGHMWEAGNWGYSTFFSRKALLNEYEKGYATVWDDLQKKGLSAAVYTQITDVETEANGLMTYDRAVLKIDFAELRRINTGHFVPAPEIDPPGGLLNAGDTVVLRSRAGADIFYSTNGMEPSQISTRYRGPIRMEKGGTLFVKAFAGEKTSRSVRADFLLTEKPKPRYRWPFSPKYRAGGAFGLVDGKLGSEQFADGAWQGFLENDLEVTLDLQTPQTVQSVQLNFLENTGVWIFLPKRVQVFTSTDGQVFENAGQIAFDTPAAQRPVRIEPAAVQFAARQARFLKIRAENVGHCPDWHPGKGQACWIFTDEVSWK